MAKSSNQPAPSTHSQDKGAPNSPLLSNWLDLPTFSEIAGIGLRSAQRAALQCHNGKAWNGVVLECATNGRGLQVNALTLPSDLRDIWHERYQTTTTVQKTNALTIPRPDSYHRRIAENYTLERWKLELLATPLQYPKNSPERGAALRDLASKEVTKPNGKAWKPSASTLAAWIKTLEESDSKALRRKPREEKKPRVLISRAWDKACPLAIEKKTRIAEHMATHVKSLWAAGAPGWRRVEQLASVELMGQCKVEGWQGVTLDQCRPGRSFVEKFRVYYLVALKEQNAKRFFDTQTPRIQRHRKGYKPGDIVIGDVHPMDVVREVDGRMVHARLISWLDVATYDIFVTVVMLPPGRGIRQEDIAASFVDMVQAWGLPKQLRLDNGKEYKWDAMIKGFQTLAALVSAFQAFHVSILAEGEAAEYINPEQFDAISRARAYNAPAKQIEHVFAILEYSFFSMMPGWIGGDRMNKRTQMVGQDPTAYRGADDEFIRDIGVCLDLYRNTQQKDGSSPNEKRRMAIDEGWKAVGVSREDLIFAFSETKKVKVKTGGIQLEFGGIKNWYRADFIMYFIGQTVEIRHAKWAPEAIFCLDVDGEFKAVPLVHGFAQEDGQGAKEQARLNGLKLLQIRELKAQTKAVNLLTEASRFNAAMPPAPEIPFGMVIKTEQGKEIATALENRAAPHILPRLLPSQMQTDDGEIVDLIPLEKNEPKPAATGLDPFDF